MERRSKVNACRELAVRSGRYISFDPELWGENMLNSMEKGLGEFLAKLPEEVRDEYEDKYIEKYKEWLSALSRCFSQAITGAGGWKPATFRRHEKTNNAEKAAMDRLNTWCDKVIRRCSRQQRLTGWAEVDRLQEKIDQMKEMQERMKAANKVIRSRKLADVEKVDELVALGFTEEVSLKLMEPSNWWGAGFAPFELSNNNAKIKDAEARMKRHAAMAAKEDSVERYEWGELRLDYSDERYRFVFDGRPSQEYIDILKLHGFRWSPANTAWQRQITGNASYAVKDIVRKFNDLAAK